MDLWILSGNLIDDPEETIPIHVGTEEGDGDHGRGRGVDPKAGRVKWFLRRPAPSGAGAHLLIHEGSNGRQGRLRRPASLTHPNLHEGGSVMFNAILQTATARAPPPTSACLRSTSKKTPSNGGAARRSNPTPPSNATKSCAPMKTLVSLATNWRSRKGLCRMLEDAKPRPVRRDPAATTRTALVGSTLSTTAK